MKPSQKTKTKYSASGDSHRNVKPSAKTKPPTSARAQAHALLGTVLGEKQTVDEAIAKAPLAGSDPDQRFAMLLLLTTLQHLGQIDAVIAQFLDKPLPEKRITITNALRIGAAQLLLLDTPAHAAVNESVTLVKNAKDAGFSGLVNAVLQKIAREKPSLPEVIHNLPAWLRARWEACYGADAVASMAQVASVRAPLDINAQEALTLNFCPSPETPKSVSTSPKGEVIGRRVEPNGEVLLGSDAGSITSPLGEVDSSEAREAIPKAMLSQNPLEDFRVRGFSGKGGLSTPTRLDSHIIRLAPDHPSVESLPGYDDGALFVQDIAASYPMRLLGDVHERQVLDICAAPGGKAMQLIQAGAFVTAIDRSAARMRVLKANLKRMNMQANTIVADALVWQPNRAYDAILLDAPCTATGTWRRHPEVVQHVTQTEIDEMAALQRTLLARVWSWLKPGGKLVYCVCSLEPEEGESQAAWFLNQVQDAHITRPTTDTHIPAECLTPEGSLRTLPSHMADRGGMDGFFAVCFEKRA